MFGKGAEPEECDWSILVPFCRVSFVALSSYESGVKQELVS
jgi:hypothetical protein